MSEIPAFGENGAGIFLFSILKQTITESYPPTQGYNYYRAYALKLVNNQPKIIEYSKTETNTFEEQAGYSGGTRLYLNHWLAPSETGDDPAGLPAADTKTPGGYIFVSPTSFGSDAFGSGSNDINNNTDIDGGSDSDTRLNSINDIDPDSNLWDADGFFPTNDFGNAPDTQGYFKVYGDGPGEISNGVAKPQDRPGSFNDTSTFMFKAQDIITIGDIDYNILYEIYEPSGYSFGAFDSTQPAGLKRVILCRVSQ